MGFRIVETKRAQFEQTAFFRQHDSLRCLLRFDINFPLATVNWQWTLWEGMHGQVIARQDLTDRPLVGWGDELELATSNLGLELQDQCYPYTAGDLDALNERPF